jgi:beta-glucosidase/6-phospho-beta-glucosidase/beta-galactosidase
VRVALLASTLLLACAAPAAAQGGADAPFPQGFLWGPAASGFQTEMGAGRNLDRRSDWWAWTRDRRNVANGVVTGDRPERGPGHWALFRRDARLARDELGSNAYRMGIEWSRIFPRSTAGVKVGRRIDARDLRRLDRLANRRAVRHYAAELRRVRRLGMTPFLTINHFTLPRWVHDPVAVRDALAGRGPDDPLPRLRRAGWLNRSTVREFRKLSAYLAWKYRRQVDFWTPVNEPVVVTQGGYVNLPGIALGFPPGAFSFTAAVRALINLADANAAAYDAVHARDRRARVGLVHNLVAFTPADPSSARDAAATEHADQLFNRLYLDAAIRGIRDRDADGQVDPGEQVPRLAGKADFVGVNYYFRGRVTGLDSPLSSRIPLLDFVPQTDYRTPDNPSAPACPTTCTDFGSEVYPEGLRAVLAIAGGYGLPVYVTENGVADADDDLRPRYLVQHIAAVRQAIADGSADVRGYFHWSLVDNFEWALGYTPRFGLFSYDPRTLERTARPSAALFARIARGNRIPPGDLQQHGSP